MPDICLIHNDTQRIITMTCRIGKISKEILDAQKQGKAIADPRTHVKMKLIPGTNTVQVDVLAAVKDAHPAIFNKYVDEGELLITDAAIEAAEKRDAPAESEMDAKVAKARREGEENGSKANKIIADNLAISEANLASEKAISKEYLEKMDAKDLRIAELEDAADVAPTNSDTGE